MDAYHQWVLDRATEAIPEFAYPAIRALQWLWTCAFHQRQSPGFFLLAAIFVVMCAAYSVLYLSRLRATEA